MVNCRLIARCVKGVGSHPSTGVAVNAGGINVEITTHVFGAALGEMCHRTRCSEDYLQATHQLAFCGGANLTDNLSTVGCMGGVMLSLLLLSHVLLKGLSNVEERLLVKQDLLESFAR